MARRIRRPHFYQQEEYIDFFGQRIHSILFFHRLRSKHPLVVGLDVQWKRGGSDPPPRVLQLCVGIRCLIIQLSYYSYVPYVLRSFLNDKRITFVGVWNSQDKGKLERFHHRLEIWRLLDVKDYLDGWLKNRSFEVIVAACLGHEGVRKDKDICMSDWGVRDLSYDQIVQTSHDVYVCCKLGVKKQLWKVEEELKLYFVG
ncbi:hypothetical protein V5N11_028479 [Cardamine amara subsp. amara]|uniref:3'-5' exonuclease domain-containing protein n=1 Tax=Cardamine amara subsp. amara TaxID=228776 RepID=A0ABD1BPB9_CARAN